MSHQTKLLVIHTFNLIRIRTHTMEDITKTITDKSLEELGVIEAPKPTPKTDDLDIPEFLDRRKTKIADARAKKWIPKTQRAVKPSDWTKDAVLGLLDDIRKEAFETNQGEADATISKEHLAQIVHLVATDVANGLEHAGLVYMDSQAPHMLREVIATYIQSQTKHYNGSMYRYLKVVDNG